METSLQNGAAAAGYALLFFLIFRHPLRKDLMCLLIACAVATVYNVAYDTAIHFRILTSIALFIRLLAPIEACRLCLIGRSDAKAALGLFLAVITSRALSSESLAAGYVTMRTNVSVAVAAVCILVSVFNHFDMREPIPFFSKNLWLQTLWMVLHAVMSGASNWYNATWPRRSIARWVYVAATLGLVFAYRRLLTSPAKNRPAHQAEV